MIAALLYIVGLYLYVETLVNLESHKIEETAPLSVRSLLLAGVIFYVVGAVRSSSLPKSIARRTAAAVMGVLPYLLAFFPAALLIRTVLRLPDSNPLAMLLWLPIVAVLWGMVSVTTIVRDRILGR